MMGGSRAEAEGDAHAPEAPVRIHQTSPWLGIANKRLELMDKYMAELGLSLVCRTRLKPVSGTIRSASLVKRIAVGVGVAAVHSPAS